jgi:hypothetical protein
MLPGGPLGELLMVTCSDGTTNGVVTVEEVPEVPVLPLVTPGGMVILPTLLTDPVAVAETVPLTVTVTCPPSGRFTTWFTELPDPPTGATHVPATLPEGAHVQLTPVIEAGTASVTTTPFIGPGPEFFTTIAHDTGLLGPMLPEVSKVLVMATLGFFTVSVIAVLLIGAAE